MRPVIRTLLGTATAVTLAACPFIASDASAAAAHPTHTATRPAAGHGGKHRHPKPVKRTHDKLAGQRRGTAHLVDAQLRAVGGLLTQAGTASGPDAGALVTALTADRDALQADLAAVAGATTRRQLVTLGRSAVGTRGVAGVQYRQVTALDAIAAQALSAAPADLLTNLQTQVAGLAGAPDAAAMQAALTGLTTALDDLATKVHDGAAGVLALTPTATHRAVMDAAHTATTDGTAASTDLATATSDLATLQTYFA